MFTRLRRLIKADRQLTIAQQRREAERQAQIADMRRRRIRAEQEQDITSGSSPERFELELAEAKARQEQDAVLVSVIQANIKALQVNTASLAAVNESRTTLEASLRDALKKQGSS